MSIIKKKFNTQNGSYIYFKYEESLKKLKEIIVEIEATTERLENLINDFNKLF